MTTGKSHLSRSYRKEFKNPLKTKWERNEIHVSSKEVVTNKLAKTNVYFQTKGISNKKTRAFRAAGQLTRICIFYGTITRTNPQKKEKVFT